MKDNIYNKNIEDKAWDKMLKILDKELPTKNNRNIFFWAAIFIGLIGLGYWLLPTTPTQDNYLVKTKAIDNSIKDTNTSPSISHNTDNKLITANSSTTDNALDLIDSQETQLAKSTTNDNNSNTNLNNNSNKNSTNYINTPSITANSILNSNIKTTYIRPNSTSSINNRIANRKITISKSNNPSYQKTKLVTNLADNDTANSKQLKTSISLENIEFLPLLASKALVTLPNSITTIGNYSICNINTTNKWHPFLGVNINNLSRQSGLGYDLMAGLNYDLSPNWDLGINGIIHYASYNLSSPLDQDREYVNPLESNKTRIFDETVIGSSSLEAYLSIGYKLSSHWRLTASAGLSKLLDAKNISYEADQLYSNKNGDSILEIPEEYSLEDFRTQLDNSIVLNNLIPVGRLELKYLSFKHFELNAGYIYSTKSYIQEINFTRYDISQSNINGSRWFIGFSMWY